MASEVGERPGKTESIIRALHGAFCRGASHRDLLALAARKIVGSTPSIVGAHVFVFEGGSLQLEAFVGAHTDHTRIPIATPIDDPRKLECHLADVIRNDWGGESAILSLIRRHDLVLGSIVVSTTYPHDRADADVTRLADALAALM